MEPYAVGFSTDSRQKPVKSLIEVSEIARSYAWDLIAGTTWSYTI